MGVSEVVRGALHTDRKDPAVNVLAPLDEYGCVFEMSIDESFTAHKIRAITCGQRRDGAAEDPNQCSTERIANAFEYLLIDDDSRRQKNNTVWA